MTNDPTEGHGSLAALMRCPEHGHRHRQALETRGLTPRGGGFVITDCNISEVAR